MREFNLDGLKRMADRACEDMPIGRRTPDDFLERQYDATVELIGHGTPYYRFFYDVAEQIRPAFSVELGSWRAVAAGHLACGNPDGTVVTIDIHKDDKYAQEIARAMNARFFNLHYINQWTWDAVGDVRAFEMSIEFLFIDAWHDRQYTTREWELYEPLLADRAIVVCDDILPDDPSIGWGMQQWWGEISAGRESFLSTPLHCTVPMGVMIYER